MSRQGENPNKMIDLLAAGTIVNAYKSTYKLDIAFHLNNSQALIKINIRGEENTYILITNIFSILLLILYIIYK